MQMSSTTSVSKQQVYSNVSAAQEDADMIFIHVLVFSIHVSCEKMKLKLLQLT
jgi:hypothetical protein